MFLWRATDACSSPRDVQSHQVEAAGTAHPTKSPCVTNFCGAASFRGSSHESGQDSEAFFAWGYQQNPQDPVASRPSTTNRGRQFLPLLVVCPALNATPSHPHKTSSQTNRLKSPFSIAFSRRAGIMREAELTKTLHPWIDTGRTGSCSRGRPERVIESSRPCINSRWR